jgi:hypothetical protein
MSDQQEEQKKQYKLKVSEEVEAGLYANAASVHINNNECVLDFAYTVPNKEETIIKVVSRLNLSHNTAKSLIKVLSNAILDWENKQKEKNK